MKRRFHLTLLVVYTIFSLKIVYAQSDVPILSSPANGATVTTTEVDFEWNAPSNAINYELQVATDPNFSDISADVQTNGEYTSYPLPLDLGTYYWRVSAYIEPDPNDPNQDYWGPFSLGWSFTVSVPPKIDSYSASVPAGFNAEVSIIGENFGDSQGTGSVLFFCGDPNLGQTISTTRIINWFNNEIDCIVPMHASSGPVIITTSEGLANSASNTLTYNIPWGYLHKWNTTQVNYQIQSLNNYKGSTPAAQLTTAINNAAAQWLSQYTDAQFNIYNNTTLPIGPVAFDDKVPSGDNALTTATDVNGIIQMVRTELNESSNFDTQYDLQAVMTHEFGHWLGLSDLYGSADDVKVMYGAYTGLRKLTQNEINGAEAIYGVGIITGIGNGNPIPFPTAVANIQASINGQNIVLTWSQNSSISATIEIFKNNFSTPIETQGSNSITYIDPNGMASLPVTYMVAVTNSAGIAYSLPITISSNTISSNTNWQGIVYTSGSVTLNSGYALTIQPGTTIYFPSGASLAVNGLLTVNGNSVSPVMFTSTGSTSPGSWGSIVLNGAGANNSTLSYANIQYGTEIDVQNVSNVTIQNCTITNNSGHGINFSSSTGSVLYNTIANSNVNHGIYVQNGSTVTCQYNHIYKTNQNRQGVGILYSGGSGTVGENDVDYYNWGIASIWGGSISADLNPSAYNNRITNCVIGLNVYYQSFCQFGVSTSHSSWGLNSIHDNTNYNAAVGLTYSNIISTLYAESDWWGSNPPNSNLFYKSSACNGYFTYPQSGDPWSGIPIPRIQSVTPGGVNTDEVSTSSTLSNNYTANLVSKEATEEDQSTPTDSLLIGVGILGQKNYRDAENFFITYLNKHPENQAAYVELFACADNETIPSLIQYFKSLPAKAAKEHKLLLSYLYLRQGDPVSAKSVNDEIIANNPNTTLGTKAKLNNFYISLYNNNDLNSALAFLNQVTLNAALLTPVEISDAQHALNFYVNPKNGAMPRLSTQQGDNESVTASWLPKQNQLMDNYPNPFNPSTVIKYQLVKDGFVTLRVFDILGREIKTLVNNYQTQGTYSVSFDASKLASGIYFYQLKSGNFMSTKKMILTK